MIIVDTAWADDDHQTIRLAMQYARNFTASVEHLRSKSEHRPHGRNSHFEGAGKTHASTNLVSDSRVYLMILNAHCGSDKWANAANVQIICGFDLVDLDE